MTYSIKCSIIFKKEAGMASFVKAMDDLPLIVKIILALPMIDIIWVVYRIIKSASKESVFGLILGVILLIVGIPFLWLVDIITLIVSNKVLWVD